MKILPITEKKYTSSFKSIYVEDFNPKFSNLRNTIKTETEQFISKEDNVSKLGEGIGGKTFRYKSPSLKNFVIKTTKDGYNDDYIQEYKNLMALPIDKIGGQEAVARIYDSIKNKYYLISTLVQGHTASLFHGYKDSHFKSLFNKMFELDKLGIYHGDLNGKNILLNDSGNVNLIDYQWTQFVPQINFYDTEKIDKMLLPRHVFPENAQMFEMASMPYYIENFWTNFEKIRFIKKYLQAKSVYHDKRAQYITKLIPNWYLSEKHLIEQSLSEEKAKVRIYRSPNDNVLQIELKKFQFLSDYRDAYSHVDANLPDRNIIASTSAYLCAISSVQDFRKTIQQSLNTCINSNEKTYLLSMLKYGDYWYKNLKGYSSDTFNYVIRALENNPSFDETKHRFYINNRNPREIKANRELLEPMGTSFMAQYVANFDIPHGIQSTIKNMYSPAISVLLENVKYDTKSNHQIDKVKSIIKSSNKFNNEERYLDLLNISQLAILKIREFKSYIKHNINSYSSLKVLNILLENVTEFTETLFNRMQSSLKYERSNDILVKGYRGMRKFKAKI